MAPDQRRLVKQIGRVLLVVVFVTLGSITTLGLGPPPLTTTTSPSPQQARNDHVPALTTTPTVTYSHYFPLIYHDYTPFFPPINGDFETCDQTGWDTAQGSFAGHGSGLPQAVVSFEDSCRARIGDPSAQNGAIPVGSGIFAQTFTVDKRYLTFRYRILTHDIIRGAQTGRYFDTFEVSLNIPPDQISDSERNNKGCSTTLLNPTGSIIPSEGLVLCGGHNGSEADVGTLRDLGWREVTLDLQNFQQTNITLYFALWSREYEPDRFNDQALYNTWVYIDDVRLGLCALDTIEQLIHAEAEAVNKEKISIIQDIFAPDALIRDEDRNLQWPDPIIRYNLLFTTTDYRNAIHFGIQPVGPIAGTVAYVTSGSQGEFRAESGQIWTPYCNPPLIPTAYCEGATTEYGSDHWTFGKDSLGCWEITEFSFNAGHVPFPSEDTN
jgi:hypothetical protein